MRIFIDARVIQDHFPGIGRYVFNLINALAPQLDGALLALVAAHAVNTRYDLGHLVQHPNVTLIRTGIPIFGWRSQTALPSLIRDHRPDLVHFPYNVRPLRVGVPSVLTLYDVIPRRFPHYFPRLTRWKIEIIQRLAIKASAAYVAISRATAADFARLYGIPSGRITVSPLAADGIFQPPAPATLAALRQRLALPKRYILYVGSNKPHKNLPRLVKAWAQVRRRSEEVADAKLIIAGRWDERYDEAKRLAESLPLRASVRFLGPVADADLPALYAGAAAFFFPSLYEGFGLPALEAMACGAAVACSNTSSLPEIAGEAALLFDPTRVEAIAEAMLRLLTDASLRAELAQRGRAQAQRFTWERTAHMTLQVYKNLAGGGE